MNTTGRSVENACSKEAPDQSDMRTSPEAAKSLIPNFVQFGGPSTNQVEVLSELLDWQDPSSQSLMP